MKLIIAGSRSISDMKILEKAIAYFDIKVEDIKEIVSGGAYGSDKLGEFFASNHNIPIKVFPAKWDDLTTEPIYIKTRKDGVKYNALAGFVRNHEMSLYGDKLLALWLDSSPGTENMIEEMKKQNKEVFVYEI